MRQVVLANRCNPDAESGGSLYLRPFVFGTNPVLGVKPASEFQFRLFASPVGSYFAGGARPLRLRITDFDRAAPTEPDISKRAELCHEPVCNRRRTREGVR